MDLTPYLMSWGILVLLLIVVAIYRQSLTSREDDSVHLHQGEEKTTIDKQAALAKKISRVGTCVKILLGILAVTGLAMLALYLHYRLLGTESRAI